MTFKEDIDALAQSHIEGRVVQFKLYRKLLKNKKEECSLRTIQKECSLSTI